MWQSEAQDDCDDDDGIDDDDDDQGLSVKMGERQDQVLNQNESGQEEGEK